MKSKPSSYKKIPQLVSDLLLLFLSSWFINEEVKSGIRGDQFYLQWASGRLLAVENKNPYTSRIPLPDFLEDSSISQGFPRKFNTPLYSLFITMPFILFDDFNTAFLAWLIFSELLILLLFLSFLRFSEWKIHPAILLVVLTYLGFNFYSFRALSAGSLIIPTSICFMLSFLALKSSKNELAAVLLAFTSIQLHFYFLIYVLALLWAFSMRKWSYIVWFLATFFILSILSAFIIPGWALDYLRTLWNFKANFNLWTPADVLLTRLPGVGDQLGRTLTIVASIYLIIEWILARGKDVQWFFWTACLTLTISQLIGLPVDLSEQFILVIPILLILSVWVQRTRIQGQRIMLVSLIGLIGVPWYLAYKAGLENTAGTPSIALFFLLPLVIFVGVFWIRWWAVRPMRLYIEELRGNELG